MHNRWRTRPTPEAASGRPEAGRLKRLVVGAQLDRRRGDVASVPARASARRIPATRSRVLAPRGPAAIYRAAGSADEVLVRSFFLARRRGSGVGTVRRGLAAPELVPRRAVSPVPRGAPRRIGYATDGADRSADRSHAAARRAPGISSATTTPCLSAHGIPPDPDPPRLPLPEAARRAADRALRAAGLTHAVDRLVLLSPGSAKDADEALAGGAIRGPRATCSPSGGLRARSSSGPDEAALGVAVSRRREARRFPSSAPTWIPSASRRCCRAARLLVSNDSGPMHLAAAVGTPVVAFFGPTDPGPHGPRRRARRGARPLRLLLPVFPVEVPVRARVHEGDYGGDGAGGVRGDAESEVILSEASSRQPALRVRDPRYARDDAARADAAPARRVTSAPYSSTPRPRSSATPDGTCWSRTGRPGASEASSATATSLMWASCGVRLPFLTLQERQAQTTFSQVEVPPRESGMTWSSDSSEEGKRWPQYWQRLPSRR